MICPNCGFQNEEGNRFCGQCGCKLEKSGKKKKPIPVLLLICVILILLLFFFAKDDAPSVPEMVETPTATVIPVATEAPEILKPAETAPIMSTISEGYIEYIAGEWESATLRDGSSSLNTHAFVFTQELKQCREMTVTMNVSMKAGTSCKDWQVWGRTNGNFKKIAKIYLPDGNGVVTQTLEFDMPVTIDALIITPTIPGGYSWSLGYVIWDVWVDV